MLESVVQKIQRYISLVVLYFRRGPHLFAEPKKRAKRRKSRRKRKERIRKTRNLVLELKAKPCTDCGRVFPPEAMDFDHLPSYKKLHSIADLTSQGRLTALLTELQKCELVCACCHRIRTARRLRGN